MEQAPAPAATEQRRLGAVQKTRKLPLKRRGQPVKRRVRQALGRRAPDLVVLAALAAAAACVVAFVAYTSGPDGLSGKTRSHPTAPRRVSGLEPQFRPFRPPRAAVTAETHRASGTAPAVAPAPLPLARVVVDAKRGPSWVVARVGSATGKVLYAATLP